MARRQVFCGRDALRFGRHRAFPLSREKNGRSRVQWWLTSDSSQHVSSVGAMREDGSVGEDGSNLEMSTLVKLDNETDVVHQDYCPLAMTRVQFVKELEIAVSSLGSAGEEEFAYLV